MWGNYSATTWLLHPTSPRNVEGANRRKRGLRPRKRRIKLSPYDGEIPKDRPIAHSTVQTLLRQLETKGVVTHDKEDRSFVFRPLYHQAQVTETPLRELLQRVYHGSIVNLMSHLLKHEHVSPEELARLREMIDEETRQ